MHGKKGETPLAICSQNPLWFSRLGQAKRLPGRGRGGAKSIAVRPHRCRILFVDVVVFLEAAAAAAALHRARLGFLPHANPTRAKRPFGIEKPKSSPAVTHPKPTHPYPTHPTNETPRHADAAPAMSEKELRAAMASLEDADDVEAGRALEKEAADEQLEFDDNTGTGGGASTKVTEGKGEEGKGPTSKRETLHTPSVCVCVYPLVSRVVGPHCLDRVVPCLIVSCLFST